MKTGLRVVENKVDMSCSIGMCMKSLEKEEKNILIIFLYNRENLLEWEILRSRREGRLKLFDQ